MVEDYYPVYKCPICNRLHRLKPVKLETVGLVDTISIIQKMSQFATNPYLARMTIPMHVACECSGGSVGYAAFAGFEKVKKVV